MMLRRGISAAPALLDDTFSFLSTKILFPGSTPSRYAHMRDCELHDSYEAFSGDQNGTGAKKDPPRLAYSRGCA